MPEEPVVVRLLREHRRSLVAREDAQLRRMAAEYIRIERGLADQMLLLAQEIDAAKFADKAITEQLVAEMARYQRLDAQLKAEILRFAKGAAAEDIAREQRAYAQAGISGATEAIKASFIGLAPTFRTLSTDAFEDMVGMLGDGTPLYRLLKEAYPDALDGVIKGLLDGVARGIGPEQTAKEMAKGMGLGLDRITLIARTEQLRMWRTSSVEQYRKSGVVKGFKRLCAKDERTCLACLARDGEFFELESELGDHPRGRCTSVPVVIGAPEVQWETGQEWFNKLSPAQQEEMMGQGMYELFQDKGFSLDQMSGLAESKVWGNAPRVLSLEELKSVSAAKAAIDIPAVNVPAPPPAYFPPQKQIDAAVAKAISQMSGLAGGVADEVLAKQVQYDVMEVSLKKIISTERKALRLDLVAAFKEDPTKIPPIAVLDSGVRGVGMSVLDGNQRLRAARSLGLKSIWAVVMRWR